MINTNSELLPCPFCGYALPLDEGLCVAKVDEFGEETDEADWQYTGICCANCVAYVVGDGRTRDSAIAAWNRRALVPPATGGGANDEQIALYIEALEALGYDVLRPSVRVPAWKGAAADDLEAAWLALVEKDDRTSSEEYPDHVLITKDELRSIVASCSTAPTGGGVTGEAPKRSAVLGDENDLHSVAHALDIGGIGTPYRAYQGSLYCDYQPHRIADFQDYGLALAASVLFNNAKAIKAVLAHPAPPAQACSDCPPAGYPTDSTRCALCPLRAAPPAQDGLREALAWIAEHRQLLLNPELTAAEMASGRLWLDKFEALINGDISA